jgi:hypothetical protein
MAKYTNPNERCIVCNKKGIDYHHIKSRGAGGTDHDWNLLPLCRKHHTEVHKIGLRTFAQKYPNVSKFLRINGWQFNPILLNWSHEEKKEMES